MKTLLVSSAQIYYDFLENNGLGVEKIRIKTKAFEGSKLYIHLAQKLFNLEGLLLRLGEKDFYIGDEEEILLLSYDEQKLILILEFLIPTTPFEGDFELLSDLKFLVWNVKTFFENQSIEFPSKLPLSIQEEEIPKERLAQEQIRAIKVIFSSPLSYIWGAPGSGKTQRVLFESLLLLIKKDKKVALLAPTNHALEQALKTLIKKCDELGLNRNLFLRLGVPTAEFLAFYPECCDGTMLRKEKLSLFTYSNPKERLEEARVLAMTLDAFIKRYESLKINFDHIFLDECGFSPLIKACSMCANSSAITLLGDHKQLMPVCEMPQKELQHYPEVKLWNLSALFLEALFEEKEGIFTKKRLDFQKTKTATLKHTYRYGDNLAKILDSFIYRNGLRGEAQKSGVFFVDAQRFLGDKLKGENYQGHTNVKEVEAVLKILPKMSEDYAVITPFVKQRQLFIQNGVSFDRVFTIHGSQGQEFETVIFSPVGLHYHLTDSSNSLALQALNVAISRVKKNLILVCDVAFWRNCPAQFLSVILSIAQPLNLK